MPTRDDSILNEVLDGLESLAAQYKGFEDDKRATALKATIAADVYQHAWLMVSGEAGKLKELINDGKVAP